MNKTWMLFEKGQPLPKEHKDVLVRIQQEQRGLPEATVVGYLRYAAGDKDSPFFVCPGVGGRWKVLAWCDCLPKGIIRIVPFQPLQKERGIIGGKDG